MERCTNVLIVEDDKMIAEMLRMYIESVDRYRLVKIVENALLAPVHCAHGEVQLILMDVYTQLGADGIAAAEVIKKESPEIKIIIITGMPEFSYIKRAREAGVESFWYKEADKEELLELMDKTMAGESVYPTETPLTPFGLTSNKELTDREVEVLRGVVRGDTNAEISEKLFLSVETVKMHVKSLLSKTGFRTRTELAVRARETGLVIFEE